MSQRRKGFFTRTIWCFFLFSLAACGSTEVARRSFPDPSQNPEAFEAWQNDARGDLRPMLGIPPEEERVELNPQHRGTIERAGVAIEKWVYTAEPGSRVPALLYRPTDPDGPLPAVVLTYGHGASKSHPSYQYIAQLYAKMGVAVLAADPIGEEERHRNGERGTRAHDRKETYSRADRAGRLIMGKLVFDTMRGITFLRERDDVDPERIGVTGNSLGGATAGWMAVLEPRVSFAMVSGWAFGPIVERTGKHCTRAPNRRMRTRLSWRQYLALASPHCDLIVMNGEADVIIDKKRNGKAWRQTRRVVESVEPVYDASGNPDGIAMWMRENGGHRPYPAHPDGVQWMLRRARPDGFRADPVDERRTVNFGKWADRHGIEFENLYGTDLHLRGATLLDMNVQYLSPETLSVLRDDELGTPRYTLSGWLKQIENGG